MWERADAVAVLVLRARESWPGSLGLVAGCTMPRASALCGVRLGASNKASYVDLGRRACVGRPVAGEVPAGTGGLLRLPRPVLCPGEIGECPPRLLDSVAASIRIANSASTASVSRRRRSPSARARARAWQSPASCDLRCSACLTARSRRRLATSRSFGGHRVLQLLAAPLAFSDIGLEPGDALLDGRLVAGLFVQAVDVLFHGLAIVEQLREGGPALFPRRRSRRRRGVPTDRAASRTQARRQKQRSRPAERRDRPHVLNRPLGASDGRLGPEWRPAIARSPEHAGSANRPHPRAATPAGSSRRSPSVVAHVK